MRIDIGSNLIHDKSFTKVDLPRLSSDFYEVLNVSGKGAIISVALSYKNEKNLFQMEIDGQIVFDFDVSDIKDMFKYSDARPASPISYNDDRELLEITFNNPILYSTGFVIKTKSNENKNNSDLVGYSVIRGEI